MTPAATHAHTRTEPGIIPPNRAPTLPLDTLPPYPDAPVCSDPRAEYRDDTVRWQPGSILLDLGLCCVPKARAVTHSLFLPRAS